MTPEQSVTEDSARSQRRIDQPVHEFIGRVEASVDLSDAWCVIRDAFVSCGVDFVTYMYMRPRAPDDGAIVLSNLPGWWADYYQDADLARHDPFFKTCYTFTPTRCGPAYVEDNARLLRAEEKRFIHDAGETGFKTGIACPVRLANPGRFGGWLLGSCMQRPEYERYLPSHCEHLQFMSFIAHETLQLKIPVTEPRRARKGLSARERECLLWLARGPHSYEIADRLNIATVTVDLHFKRIRAKLGAATREEALAKAVLAGDIVP